MKKLLLLSLIVFSVIFSVKAQSDKSLNNKNDFEIGDIKHGIGGAAGFTTGYGLSYRYYLDGFVFQGTFSPAMESKKDMTFSSGLTFMYRLVRAGNTNLYLYESNHWNYYYGETDNNYQNYNGEIIDRYHKNKKNYIHSGIGVGLEFIFWDRVSLNIMTGYSFKYGTILNEEIVYNNGILEKNSSSVSYIKKLHPTIEAGLYYCF